MEHEEPQADQGCEAVGTPCEQAEWLDGSELAAPLTGGADAVVVDWHVPD